MVWWQKRKYLERMKQLDLHYPKLSEEGLKQLEDCKKSVSDINF